MLYSLIELDSSRCLNVLLRGWKIALARKEEEGKRLAEGETIGIGRREGEAWRKQDGDHFE